MASTMLQFSASRLRAAFEESGLSKSALARAIATGDHYSLNNARNRVRWYLDGKVTPTPSTVAKLAEVLGCKVSELYVEVEL